MTHFEQAVVALSNARDVVLFTGAGISIESGIPTYRDPLTGIWAQHDPRDLETSNAFRNNPPFVWGWYLWRRQQVINAQPNAAHLAVGQLAATGRKGLGYHSKRR